MKKTLRFTLLLCLVVALMATVSACFEPFEQIPEATTPAQTTPDTTTPEVTTPEVTTPEVTTPEVTTPEVTTPVEEPDPNQPEGSVLVDSIGGKTVVELLEKFVEDFATAKTYDFTVSHEYTGFGVTTSEFVSLKIGENTLAININMEFMVADIYFVDGIIYMNTGEQKIKIPAQNVDDVMGEGFLDSLQEGPDFSEEDFEELADAKIYLLGDTYIVTFLSTDEDTGEEVSTRLEFNADGELLLMEGTGETEHTRFVINSYGKPVTVTPPADADEYVSLGSDPEIPEGAVAVDTLNGMNARQLLDKFLTEYPTAKTYDIKVSIQQFSMEEMMNMNVSVKIGESSMYFQMEMDGEMLEMWVVDSIAYVNMNGEKTKQEGLASEDVFGDGTIDSMINSAIKEMPEVFYTFVDQAQLYELDGVYFFTVSLSLPEMGVMGMTETIYFDENGNVIRILDETESLIMDIIVNSYGRPVEILPPEDADEYLEGNLTPDMPENPDIPEIPETDDEIYALYSDMCTMLQDSDHFSVYIDIGEEYYVVYEIAGNNKYLMLNGEENVEQWLIDQEGYMSVDSEEIFAVDVDVAFLESFTSFEEFFPIDVFAQEELQNLRCSYDEEWGEIVVEFEYASDSEHLSQCKYALAADASYVDITATEFVNGEEEVTCNFFFTIDPDLEITLPEVE